jgi:biopolymer transport protein ExbD
VQRKMKNLLPMLITGAILSGCASSIDLATYSRESASPDIFLPALTNSTAVADAPAGAVHVELHQRGHISIARAYLSRRQLSAVLNRIREERGIEPIFIWADQNGTPSDLRALVQTVEDCGFDNLWTVGIGPDGEIRAKKMD